MSFIKNPVIIITRKIATPDQNLVVDYPVVIGMANQAVQQKINNKSLIRYCAGPNKGKGYTSPWRV